MTNPDKSAAPRWGIECLRPDGWWEAGRGWSSPAKAVADGAAQLPKHVKWRVVPETELTVRDREAEA